MRIEITPRTILWVLVAMAAVWLFQRLWPIAIIVLIALVLVGTLNPLVAGLARRGVGRGVALAIVFLSMLVVISLLLVVSVPPLVGEVMRILQDAPAQRHALIEWLDSHRVTAGLAPTVRDIEIDQVTARMAAYLVDYSSLVIKVFGYAITILFLAFYLLADGAGARGAVFALVPRDYHLRLARILLNLETIVGGYMRGQLITSAAIGLFTFALLTILQVPNALSIAVFAALTDVIPFIGGILATAPAVLAALSRGSGVALIVLVALVIYQEFESRILVPRVYGRVLRLSPAAVIIALLVGGTLLGIVGALLALPVAAGLQMMVRELRVELPGDDSDDRALRERDERAEQTYEHLSAGAAPETAAMIAGVIAQSVRDADASDPAVAAEVPITGGLPDEDDTARDARD